MYDFPANPAPGDEYVAPVGGQTYVWTPPKWLVKGIPPVGLGYQEPSVTEAPIDGKQYGRKDAQWSEVIIPPDDWNTMANKPATFPYAKPIPQADVANLTTDLTSLSGRVTATETINTTQTTAISQLQTADVSLDTRLDNLEADVTTWAEITGKPVTFPPTLPIAETDVTNLLVDLAAKAPLASPTLTGDPKAPTPTTADNDTSIATTAHVQANAALKVAKAGDTMTGKLVGKASDTATAPINLPQGVSPTSPVDGDIWMNGTTLTVRGSSTSYAVAYLNGSSTFTGTKTFSAPPIMTTSTTALASVRLPHGVAPTAPVDGDMWTTSAGLFVRVSGTTIGPLAAASGGAAISDTPPGSPYPGQMWFESDTGRTYVWYSDANSSQWVMIGPGGAVQTPFTVDTNGDAVIKFGANIMVRILPSGLIMTKDDIEIFSVSV